jgi:RHS repeat-associated protein
MNGLRMLVVGIAFAFVASAEHTHASPNQIGSITHTHHSDHLSTPQRFPDKAGNLLWSAQYDAYGKAQVQTTASAQPATVNPLRQSGQYLDLETGLHYNERRYYDADTGRYASRDPIGFESSINLYSFQTSGQLSGFSV